MIYYLTKRLILAAVTLFIILFTSYALLRLAPGDPSRSDMMGGEGAGMLDSRNSELNVNTSMREQLDLDKPLPVGFFRWLSRIVKEGNFGTSVTVDPGKPVASLIRERLGVTLSLNFWAILITYLLAIPAGVFTAGKEGSFFDRSVEISLFVLYSLPVMWAGLLLQSLLCEGGTFPIFPLKGIAPENPDELSIWQLQLETLRGYFLPVLCLTYGGFAGLSRYTRSSMLEVLRSDFIRTARAKGLSYNDILWKHGFRNALITMITLFGGILPSLVSGSVLIEYIFNIPGMGSLSLLSLSSRDYPLQMALFAFSGALTLAGLLVSDLLYMLADPRIRLDK
ncbi:MAG: ABC transporter permease [Lentisphaerae bacterium]|nr:ABC transporter permease [Lentisphaerota bacterium]